VKKKPSLTANAFERFLNWLNPDREKAGDKYLQIRLKLTEIFARRGCLTPDELADETIDRVIRKAPEIADTYSGDPQLYFYAVAKYVYLEYVTKSPVPQPPPQYVEPEGQAQRLLCLDECLARLDRRDCEFILQYQEGEKSERINHRREMAESAGVTIETLRMRAHRIKSFLKKCVRGCMAKTE
jgi:DNA-directed RNA polymerase specialized sigma24 family protein